MLKLLLICFLCVGCVKTKVLITSTNRNIAYDKINVFTKTNKIIHIDSTDIDKLGIVRIQYK